MNTETTFTEYDMYYDTPIQIEGQCTQIGRRYFTPELWLPILAVDEEYNEKIARIDAARQPYRGRSLTAEELDEECTRVHEANEQHRKYGRA